MRRTAQSAYNLFVYYTHRTACARGWGQALLAVVGSSNAKLNMTGCCAYVCRTYSILVACDDKKKCTYDVLDFVSYIQLNMFLLSYIKMQMQSKSRL